MKSLGTLLKIARRQLETLRIALAAEMARLRQVDDELAENQRVLTAEQAFVQRDHESALAYQAYAIRAKQQRTLLEARRNTISAEIDRLRALIAEAHVEARKFERLIDLERARERALREKRADAELDEFATLRSGRRS